MSATERPDTSEGLIQLIEQESHERRWARILSGIVNLALSISKLEDVCREERLHVQGQDFVRAIEGERERLATIVAIYGHG